MKKKDALLKDLMPESLLQPSERSAFTFIESDVLRFRSFYILIQLSRLFAGNVFLRIFGQRSRKHRQTRTIKYLQRLGLIWIKVAQSLMLRNAALSTDYGLELLNIKDCGEAHSIEEIRQFIEEELSIVLVDVFDCFDAKPFYSTTVSQYHKAHLRKEQIWVTVKIQHPHAENILNRDLTLFHRIIRIANLLHIQTGMRWDDLLHELNEIKIRELNYHYEANALETLDKNLSGQPAHVPRVFSEYSNKRILVNAYIRGALLSDIILMREKYPKRLEKWLETNNIDLKVVARRIFHSIYRQVFEYNFFHGDMHTGNIILLRNSHFAVIECRSAGSMEMESLTKQKMYLRSLAEGEYVTASEIYFLLVTQLPKINLNIVKEKLVRIWRAWETRTHITGLPYKQKSLTYMNGEVNQVFSDAGFSPLWTFSKLTGALVHLDISLSNLSNDINYLKQLRLYFSEEQRRYAISEIKKLPSRASSSLLALNEMPKRIADYNIFEETKVRREAIAVYGSVSKLNVFIATSLGFCSFVMFLSTVFLFLIFLTQFNIFSTELLLGPQLTWIAMRIPALNLTTWLAILALSTLLYIFSRIQKSRFSRKEFGKSNIGE